MSEQGFPAILIWLSHVTLDDPKFGFWIGVYLAFVKLDGIKQGDVVLNFMFNIISEKGA